MELELSPRAQRPESLLKVSFGHKNEPGESVALSPDGSLNQGEGCWVLGVT